MGEIAARIYRHRANDDTVFGDVVDARSVEQLLAGAAQLQLTQRLIRLVLESPVTVDACVEVVQRAVATSMSESAHGDGLGRQLAEVLRRRLARAAEPALPVIESGVDRLNARARSQVARQPGCDR